MSLTIDRGGTRARTPDQSRRRHGGPVVLATFESARFDAQAARVAVESAADMRSTLFVAQILESRSGRSRARRAAEPVPAPLAATLDAVKERAEDLGVEVEALRVSSPQPIGALLAFVADRRAALVVLASDPAVLRRFRRPTRRQYRRFVTALAEHASCLLWTAQDPVADAALSASMPSSWARPAPMRRARPGRARTMANPTRSQIATTNGKRS